MSTNEDTQGNRAVVFQEGEDIRAVDTQGKRAVVFQEGEDIRAVLAWTRDAAKALQLVSLELEMRGTDAMGVPRWNSHGFVVEYGALCLGNSPTTKWTAAMLINRAERWLKENV